jgi:hypothetical protein
MTSHANVKQAASPGIKINTSATDFAPIKQLQMMRFKGEKSLSLPHCNLPPQANSSRGFSFPTITTTGAST